MSGSKAGTGAGKKGAKDKGKQRNSATSELRIAFEEADSEHSLDAGSIAEDGFGEEEADEESRV